MQNRREFMVASGMALLSPVLSLKADSVPEDAQGEWRNRQSGMAYRRLGRTGYMISEVVMGGNTIAPDNCDHVRMSLDAGLNYLDTAPAYGQGKSELGYAEVLKSRRRDTLFLNTKVSLWDVNRNRLFREIYDSLPESDRSRLKKRADEEIARRHAAEPDYFVDYFNSQRDELDAAALSNVMEGEFGRRIDRNRNHKQLILDSVDQSLVRLGTDHLDLLMCPHGANTPQEVLGYPEIFEAFEILKKAGKVRHLGLSAHTDPAGVLEAAADAGIYSAAMVAYNIVNHRYVARALERARKSHIGVIAMKVARPVQRGAQPGPEQYVKRVEEAVPGSLKTPQKAYLWALRNPNLTAVISEMANADQVKDNLPLAGRKA